MKTKNLLIKYITTIIITIFLFTSCEDNWGDIESNPDYFSSQDLNNNSSSSSSSSSGCTLNCSPWEDCVRRGSGDPFDFFGPKSWRCENIYVTTFNRRFYSSLIITDESGNNVSKDILIIQKYPNENTVGFTIEEEGYNERFDIYVQFSNPSYGDFIVESQSVYNPILDEYITYSGTGTLTKNGSSCYYTITLDLNYSYNGINFNYNCIGSDDISLY